MIDGCAAHLNEGRYTWRLYSILKNLADHLTVIRNVYVYADVDGYPSASVISGDNLWPDIVIIKGNLLYILELTIGFESSISKNVERKKIYTDLIENLHRSCDQKEHEKVLFVNLSLGALGIIVKESQCLKKC